jgi:hypothetical protein
MFTYLLMTLFDPANSDSKVMPKIEYAISEESARVGPTEPVADDSIMGNRIWRKLDLYILPLASVFYFLSFLVDILFVFFFYPYPDALFFDYDRIELISAMLASLVCRPT